MGKTFGSDDVPAFGDSNQMEEDIKKIQNNIKPQSTGEEITKISSLDGPFFDWFKKAIGSGRAYLTISPKVFKDIPCGCKTTSGIRWVKGIGFVHECGYIIAKEESFLNFISLEKEQKREVRKQRKIEKQVGKDFSKGNFFCQSSFSHIC